MTDTNTDTGIGTGAYTGTGTTTNQSPADPQSQQAQQPTNSGPSTELNAKLIPPDTQPAITDLSKFIADLSPDQLERVRKLAQAHGISSGPKRDTSGSWIFTVAIPDECYEPLKTWAEEAGSDVTEFINKIAGDAITNYCFGDWSAVRPASPVEDTSKAG